MADRSFKNINVDIYSISRPSRTIISWDWNPSVIPLNRYKIDVFRGESPEEMERIAKDVDPVMFSQFEDNTALLISKERAYYYRLEAKNTKSGAVIISDLITKEGFLDLVGIYIVEEHNFLFRNVTGVPVLIYKKQTDSKTRCTECWDSVLKRVTKSSCTTCHGTGMIGKGIGGYYNPTYTWIDLSPEPKVVQTAQWGKTEPTQTDAFMSNYPQLTIGDIVIELSSDKRWKVIRVQNTEKRRSKMLQITRLDLINKDQIEYTIKVPLDIKKRSIIDLNNIKNEREF